MGRRPCRAVIASGGSICSIWPDVVRRLRPGVHGGVWRVTHELKNDTVKEPLERFPPLILIMPHLGFALICWLDEGVQPDAGRHGSLVCVDQEVFGIFAGLALTSGGTQDEGESPIPRRTGPERPGPCSLMPGGVLSPGLLLCSLSGITNGW